MFLENILLPSNLLQIFELRPSCYGITGAGGAIQQDNALHSLSFQQLLAGHTRAQNYRRFVTVLL